MHLNRMKKRYIFSGFAQFAAICMLAGCGGETLKDPSGQAVDTVEESAEESEVSGGGELVIPEEDAEAPEEDAEAPEEDSEAETVPILRDAVREKIGGFAGCAVTGQEIDDPEVWRIVTTHFEAVTLGNELKPDALVGYSVGKCPGTETVELNGEDIEVPILDYSRAEYILDRFLQWNSENPDRQIRIRGHVLVWHSQTPEWFFHEDYDKNKAYADAATMDRRLEWYIKTVLTHFTGEDSRYRELFYGWDVLNEAVSDGTGTYRSDAENPGEPLSEDRHGSNSSWWHVYQSNEYIINAFRYANKYAPAELELYYNDYNECELKKQKGILELLRAVKAQEGPPGEGTRISAMGMQGHYGMDRPSAGDIKIAAILYSKEVGKVQLTEVDISASPEYTGQEDQKEAEYAKLTKRYEAIWKMICENSELFSGVTFWGTVDHYSWLQSRSNVGGGNKTGLPQCPLLFDEHYEPKPCFYVFTE